MDYRIYSVHGIFAADSSQRGSRWWQKESPFSDAVLSYLDTDKYRITWEPFRWSGENKSSERGKAAVALARVLSQIDHRTNKVALLAHSHGGNIAYNARNIAKSKSHVQDLSVVTVGTPFIFESHFSPWLVDKSTELVMASFFALVACLTGLWFAETGTIISNALAISAIAIIVVFALSVYFKAIPRIASLITRDQQGILKFLFKPIYSLDEKVRRRNPIDPKIYSVNDEAINALRAVPSQEINIATKEMSVFPAALVFSVVVFFAGVLALPIIEMTFPGDVVEDFVFIDEEINPGQLSWLNDVARIVFLLALSTVIGFLCSWLILAQLSARLFNNLFSRTIKERAYGRDTGMNRALPMYTSANLPLMFQNYGLHEQWKPIPKSLDDDLDDITINSATGMFRAMRDTLGIGVTTGSYTFSETISTNFRGR